MRGAPLGDPPERFPDDRAAHLGFAALPLGESDRHLDDPEAGPDGAPGQINLEAVPLRGDGAVVDAFEYLAPVGPVAAGNVVQADAEGQPRVEISAA